MSDQATPARDTDNDADDHAGAPAESDQNHEEQQAGVRPTDPAPEDETEG